MKTLYLDNKSWKTIQKFIGILFFLVALTYLIASESELDIAGYIIVFGFSITSLA
ncbi:MAG: hypothetical protein KBG40_02430 [Bacteroidales bacterium]|nr:hypothetical protein [Bacteroidales bacterium]